MKFKKITAVENIFIHCAATPPTADIGAKEIDQWHRKRGWLCIGYHVVIRRNGTIEFGRAETDVGAHAEGHNHNSLAVCMVGGVDAANKPANNFTPAQWRSLEIVLHNWKVKHPKAVILGHYQVDPHKACPSFDVPKYLKGKVLRPLSLPEE